MLNFIWAFMIFIGVVTGLLLGRTKEISDAVLASCVDSIELVITMMGAMCLWSGIMRVAEKAGLINSLARLLKEYFVFFSPGYQRIILPMVLLQ